MGNGNSSRRDGRAIAAASDHSLALETLEPRLMLDGAGVGGQAVELFGVSAALFAENQGQWDNPAVHYAYDGNGANVLFTDAGPIFQVFSREVTGDASDMLRMPGHHEVVTQGTQFSVQFDGANIVSPVGLDQAQTVFNYHVGDASAWRDGVATYATVAYLGLYDGIDLHTWGQRDSLKYEFHVAPGTDYTQISVSYAGIEGLSIDDTGALHVQTALGDLIDEAPYIYQDIDGQRVEVAGAFELVDSDTYTFVLTGDYDADVELIIDPDLTWSTYVGGGGGDMVGDIAVDPARGVFIAGETDSSGWASGGYDPDYGGAGDAFVAKLTTSGSHLWSTYLGGSEWDSGQGIALSPAGEVYVTGYTESAGWVAGGHNELFGGGMDIFAAKLSQAGAHVWSTYLGGTGDEAANAIAVDAAGAAYLTGLTDSDGWVEGGYDTLPAGSEEAFVVKLTANGAHSWSTYMGGSLLDMGWSIAADGAGNIYAAGRTFSAGWTQGGYDTTFGGLPGNYDGFVVKMSSTGVFGWSTYVGGGEDDSAQGIAVAGTGGVYVMGGTFSSDGWIVGGRDTTYNGNIDAFVLKLATDGTRIWSTYVGGGGEEQGYGVTANSAGDVYVTGSTTTPGWVSGGYDTDHNGGNDTFVMKLMANGDEAWSTYMGGIGDDRGYALALDDSGGVYVAGSTTSPDWGLLGYDPDYNGGGDGFVAKIGGLPVMLIPDAGLEQAIREELNIFGRPLDQNDMNGLFSLEATDRSISDLTGLELATNLTELELDQNVIANLTPLSGLTKLTRLNLEWNKVVDVSPLASLTNLVYLDLDWNRITHIGPISSLTALAELYLMDNAFSDLSSLGSLVNLDSLNLGRNAISDILPLAGLTGLNELWLHENVIRDISALDGLVNLTELTLDNNLIRNISPLDGMTVLTDLTLQSNLITSIAPLAGLTGLTGQLDVSDNWLYVGPVSPTMEVIDTVTGQGATVTYLVQREPGQGMDAGYDMGAVDASDEARVSSQTIGDGPDGTHDVDLYKITLDAAGTVVMDVNASEDGSALDPMLRVFSVTDTAATVWNRELDWSLSQANPAPDAAGNPTYRYAWSTGTGLSNPNPPSRWYAQDGTNMVWDPKWVGGNKSFWVASNDTLPNIRWDSMTLATGGGADSTARPQVQWSCPDDSNYAVSVTGSFTVDWFGAFASDAVVDVVIARIGMGADIIEELGTWTVRRSEGTPIPNTTSKTLTVLDIATDTIFVSPSDRIVWSLRARSTNYGANTTIRMQDDLVVSGVPIEEVASNNDTDGLDPYLSLDLAPGTYYVGVSGNPNGAYDPSTGRGEASATSGPYELRLGPPGSAGPVVVAIPDAGLQAAIRATVGKPTGDIFDTDLASLTSLSADGRGIVALTGLEYCTSLVTLDLDNNAIIDVAPLSGLTTLQTLDIDSNQISNAAPLNSLVGLKNLNVYNNNISDLTPLIAVLGGLDALEIADNPITDISALTGLTGLAELDVDGLQLNSFAPLSTLTGLTSLYLNGTAIGDLAPLSALAGLELLELDGNRINDLAPLGGLANLTTLQLTDNYLYVGSGSPAVAVIDALTAGGTTVAYGLQNEPGDAAPLAHNVGELAVDGVDRVIFETLGDGPHLAADVDLFTFTLPQDGVVVLDVDAVGPDTHLRLFSAAGVEIASNNDHDGLDPYLSVDLTAGTYTVGVSGQPNTAYDPAAGGSGVASATSGLYVLRIAPPTSAPTTLTWDGADGADWASAHWNAGAATPAGGEAMVVDSGRVDVLADLSATPAGSLDIASGAADGTVNIAPASKLVVTGEVNVGVGGTLNLDGMLVADQANVTGGVLTNSRGSTASLVVLGDVALSGGGTFKADLLGTSADMLIANGAVDLGPGSSLEIVTGGGAGLFKAGTYTLLVASGGLTGTFADVTVPTGYVTVNGNGLTYDYTAGTVKLTLDLNLHPGDGNLDGATDVADRIIWNNYNFVEGTTWATGDYNGDGATDVGDRIVWNNYNFTEAQSSMIPQAAPAAGDFDQAMAAESYASLAETPAPVPSAGDGDAATVDADVALVQPLSPVAAELPTQPTEPGGTDAVPPSTDAGDAATDGRAELEVVLDVDLGSIESE